VAIVIAASNANTIDMRSDMSGSSIFFGQNGGYRTDAVIWVDRVNVGSRQCRGKGNRLRRGPGGAEAQRTGSVV